jgi:hypothetical protein
MYNLGCTNIREERKILRGKGILIFVPDNPRPKKWIGNGAIFYYR